MSIALKLYVVHSDIYLPVVLSFAAMVFNSPFINILRDDGCNRDFFHRWARYR